MPFVARVKMAFSCGHSGQTAVDNHLLTVYKKEVTPSRRRDKREPTNNGTSSLSMSVRSIIEHINDV